MENWSCGHANLSVYFVRVVLSLGVLCGSCGHFKKKVLKVSKINGIEFFAGLFLHYLFNIFSRLCF